MNRSKIRFNRLMLSIFFKLGVDLGDEDEGEDIASEDSDRSEDEDELDAFNYLRDLGLIDADSTELTKEKLLEASEKADVRRMTRALLQISKGSRLVAKGSETIHSLAVKNPSLSALTTLITPPAGVPIPVNMPLQIVKKDEIFQPGVVHIGPKRVDGNKFQCRTCNQIFKSWSGCDSHTRKFHTHIAFGPCACGYTSTNKDAFRTHGKNCNGKKRGDPAPKKKSRKIESDTEEEEKEKPKKKKKKKGVKKEKASV